MGMKSLMAALSLVRRNLFKDPGYLFRYALRYLDQDYRMSVKFMSNKELVSSLEQGKSLIRINDGEICLITYGNIHYQKFHPRLREYLLKIVLDYDHQTSPYLIGLTEEYLGKPNREIKAKQMLRIWLPVKMAFERFFPKNPLYFDAHLFYRSGAFEQVLERILQSHRVILVTSEENIGMVKKTGLEQRLEVSFVSCPASNSFDQFDEILEQVTSLIEPGREKNYRVLLAAGPASKALAYELSKRKIISYDLGRGVEAVYRPNQIEHEIYQRSDVGQPS